MASDPVYEKLGKFCLEKKISIDMFIFGHDFYDLATISPLVSITGGSLYYYP